MSKHFKKIKKGGQVNRFDGRFISARPIELLRIARRENTRFFIISMQK
jgi:hypothetical protein